MRIEGNSDNYAKKMLLKLFGKDVMQTFSRIGLLASVDVELIGRVSAGELLCYKVQQTRVHGELARFAVSAHVGERLVVRGTTVGARGGRLEGIS